MNETISIPFYILISSIGALILLGIQIKAWFHRYQDKQECKNIHQEDRDMQKEEMKRIFLLLQEMKEKNDETVQRIHERIDDLQKIIIQIFNDKKGGIM